MLLTAASRIAVHPPLQLCRSATSTWTDPVWKPPSRPHPGWFCTWCLALGCAGPVWKPPGDDCHPSFQAAALTSQFSHRLSGLCRLSNASDCDALQHGQVRGELLVFGVNSLHFSHVLWCGTLLLFSLPPVPHLHRQVHRCYWPSVYPTEFTVSASGAGISISWTLPSCKAELYSSQVFMRMGWRN